MAIGSTVYSWIFFKEINSHGSPSTTIKKTLCQILSGGSSNRYQVLSCPRRTWKTHDYWFQYDLLYWLLHPKHFLYRRKSVSTPLTTHTHSGKPMFSPFVNILLIKKCFSIYIIHSSVNFTWFTLLSHQKFDKRALFKPGKLIDLLPFWTVTKYIFVELK